MMFRIDTRNGPQAKWKPLRVKCMFKTYAEALTRCASFDPDGCVTLGQSLRIVQVGG